MLNKKAKRAVTAPTTPTIPLKRSQVEEVFSGQKKAINDNIYLHLKEVDELKKPLPAMSQELYKTREYSLKRGYKFILTIIVLLVVSGLEIPLNATGLEMLGRPQTTTTIMALGLACALGLLAEGAGFSFRRAVARGSFLGVIGALFCAGVALTIIYWLSEFRVDYFIRMKYKKEDISLTGQVVFSIAVWCAGVIGVYFLTSGVKNLHMEKVFNSKRKSIRQLHKKIDLLKAEKNILKDQHPKNLVAAEAYEANIQHEKQRAENLKNELAALTIKQNEDNLKQKSEEEKVRTGLQKDAFYGKYKALLAIKGRVEKIAAENEDKSELSVNEDYVSSMSSAETLVEEMKELVSDEIPETGKDFQNAKTILNDLKNLAA